MMEPTSASSCVRSMVDANSSLCTQNSAAATWVDQTRGSKTHLQMLCQGQVLALLTRFSSYFFFRGLENSDEFRVPSVFRMWACIQDARSATSATCRPQCGSCM